MSDLSNNSNRPHLTSVGHFPNKVVVAHLKACQTITAGYSQELFDSFQIALEEKLLEFVKQANSDQEARQLQETVRLLRINNADLARRFVSYLSEGFVKFKQKRLNTHGGEEKYSGDMLSLIDNADLEETIALSSIAHRAYEQFGETLWFLKQRLAVLNGGEKVQDHNNPVGPVQFCESMRKALSILPLSTKAKIISYKVFDGELTTELGMILREVNRYLASQDILPNLYRGLGKSSASGASAEIGESGAEQEKNRAVGAPSSSKSAAAPARDSHEYQSGLVQAIRGLQHRIAEAGSGPVGNKQNGGQASSPAHSSGDQAVYTNQQLVSALQALQTQALETSTSVNAPPGESSAIVPNSVPQISRELMKRLQISGSEGLDPSDLHTIDLVGMLFEYMLSDEQLPDSVKTILSYLHTPFLKIAFIDSSFFERAEHPARLLLNSLAEAGTRWVSNDEISQCEIYPKIKATVSRVLEDFENDVRLFAELLLDFSAHMKKIARRQELMEKRAMEKVRGEETLREVKVQVNKEIRSRTDAKELPSAVLLLLLQPWSDYLAFILLRYGDQSESWKKALGAVDQILWSVEAKQDIKDKARQLELLDDLLDVIEGGLETIGYDLSKGKKLIEALVSLQKMAMQSKVPAPAPAPMRDKLESQAAEKAGREDKPEDMATPEEEKMVNNLKMVEFGTWFEFEGGKRLKVAWYNSKTMQYMLVDQMGKKVAMKSGLELARGMLSGKARVIAGSTKPFFERALENILQNLNAKAGLTEEERNDG